MYKIELQKNKNNKLIIGFILGLLVASTITYAATSISAKTVSYNNTTSKLTSTTVQSAIDEVYNKAKNKINKEMENSMITNFGSRVFVRIDRNKKSMCINKKNKIFCTNPNEFQNSKNKLTKEFGQSKCKMESSYYWCSDGEGSYCDAYTTGGVNCCDTIVGRCCKLFSSGDVECS